MIATFSEENPTVQAASSRARQAAEDYTRIERAIAFLRENFRGQPDLAAVARAVHLSEFHFQRLFTRWAGVSPKRFVQFLTVEHAKRQLAASRDVLAAALDSGLSGPGRLHDLFVNLEAMSPGEWRRGGAGLSVRWGVHPSPFGPALLAVTERGLCALAFAEAGALSAEITALTRRWHGARVVGDTAVTAPWAERVFGRFSGAVDAGEPLPLLVAGTNLQVKVWQALLRIPSGGLVTYGTLAAAVGEPRAARAVGSAVGANEISWLIPCHRVIRGTGVIGEYRWGSARKTALLAWEAARQG